MRKVGIMSMQRIANYGSFLQAYALKQLIEEVGCNVEFVDYHVGAPVITENADSKNKVVRKIEKGLETFRYRAPLAHKLSFIRYKQSFAQKYGKHFMDGDCYRESCYKCAYANTSRVGDLTVGDFWGITKSHPSFNSPKGVSSVFVNTEKGQKLFEMMRVLAEVEEATLEEGMVKQHNLVQPSNRPVTRDTFYKSIDEPGFIENIKVGFQPKARLKSVLPNKLIQKIKSLCIHRRTTIF